MLNKIYQYVIGWLYVILSIFGFSSLQKDKISIITNGRRNSDSISKTNDENSEKSTDENHGNTIEIINRQNNRHHNTLSSSSINNSNFGDVMTFVENNQNNNQNNNNNNNNQNNTLIIEEGSSNNNLENSGSSMLSTRNVNQNLTRRVPNLMNSHKIEKQREKDERKQQQEALRHATEEKRKREEKKQTELEARRLQKEIQREEAERKLEELKKEKEIQEYDQWLHLMTVDEAGESNFMETINENGNAGNAGNAGSGNMLTEFIETIKNQKACSLEELACQFKMKTQDVIDRIRALELEGILTGVMDDRGKFLYITKQEFQNIVDIVNTRGRISLFDLTRECNKFITTI